MKIPNDELKGQIHSKPKFKIAVWNGERANNPDSSSVGCLGNNLHLALLAAGFADKIVEDGGSNLTLLPYNMRHDKTVITIIESFIKLGAMSSWMIEEINSNFYYIERCGRDFERVVANDSIIFINGATDEESNAPS